MTPTNTALSLTKIYSLTFKKIKEQPGMYLPFVIFAGLEVLALLFVFSIPRQPLRPLFGPIIATFWGEKFLHYPANFLLLDKLAFLSRMLLAIVVGSILSAMAVVIMRDAHEHKKTRLKSAFIESLKKYSSLFLLLLLVTILFYFSTKLLTIGLAKYFIAGHRKLLFIGARLWMGPFLIVGNFIISVLIQSLFIYAMPFLMIENKKLLVALRESFAWCIRFFVPTVVLIALPLLLYVPVLLLKLQSAYFIHDVFPESVLLLIGLGIIVNSLIVDPLVTLSTTVLFLENRKK